MIAYGSTFMLTAIGWSSGCRRSTAKASGLPATGAANSSGSPCEVPGGHVDVHSGRQVGRAVRPCRERQGLSIRDTWRDRAQADAEGRETSRAVVPALSDSCGSNERAPRLALIPGPPQLQQGV